MPRPSRKRPGCLAVIRWYDAPTVAAPSFHTLTIPVATAMWSVASSRFSTTRRSPSGEPLIQSVP
jgi:hypothetical protein